MDRLDAGQLDVVARLLEVMIDEGMRDLEAAREWIEIHDPVSHQKVLAAIGLTPDAFRRVVRAPIESN